MKRLPLGVFRADVSQRVVVERDAEGRAWQPLFPLGTWHRKDFPGGKMELTPDLFEEFIANWKAEGSPALPVDYEHNETDIASGWIEDLRIASSGELEGAIKWTDAAAAEIKADQRRYLSPTWAMQHTNRQTGEKAGPWLYGAALTNSPFFHSMPRVAASSADADETTHSPTTEKHMDKKRICAALGMSEDCSDEEVMAALEAKCKAALTASDNEGKLTAALKSASDNTEKLTARVAELEKKHKDELFERDFEAAFDASLKEGRQGLPALKDTLKATAKAIGLDEAKKMMAALPGVPMSEKGIGGAGDIDATPEDAVKQIETLVAEKMKAGVKATEAYRLVAAEHPKLALKANTNINAKA